MIKGKAASPCRGKTDRIPIMHRGNDSADHRRAAIPRRLQMFEAGLGPVGGHAGQQPARGLGVVKQVGVGMIGRTVPGDNRCAAALVFFVKRTRDPGGERFPCAVEDGQRLKVHLGPNA